MMYAVIVCNVLGFAVGGVDAEHHLRAPPTRRRRAGRWAPSAALQSLMAVRRAAASARRCSASSSHLPRGDWRIGAPFYFCAVLQLRGAGLAWLHFRRLAQARRGAAAASA